jgi:crotonobetainyl-CoA:carnitine CoA-transferase CaiB-like acyl-CoA transferase
MVALTTALNRPEWREDPRFSSPAARDRNVNERLEMTQEVLLTRTAAEWLEVLEAAGVPCAPALKRSEVIDFPQVAAGGTLVEYQQRCRRPVATSFSVPCAFREKRLPRSAWVPLLGEHNLQVLTEIGLLAVGDRGLSRGRIIGSENSSEPLEQLVRAGG